MTGVQTCALPIWVRFRFRFRFRVRVRVGLIIWRREQKSEILGFGVLKIEMQA